MRRAASHISGRAIRLISSIGRRSENLLSPSSLINGISRYEYNVDICENCHASKYVGQLVPY